jgi:uncharacterized protein (DUF58 family)
LKIFLKTKKKIFSDYVGNIPTIFKGSGFDFYDISEYSYGDDARNIDWFLSKKHNKLLIKRYHEERELDISIAIPSTKRDLFGTKISKIDIILEIAYIIGIYTLMQNNKFSYYLYNSNGFVFQKPTKMQKSLMNLQKMVENLATDIDYNIFFDNIIKYKKRGILFIISDLFDNLPIDKINQKFEVILIIVRDRFEENLAALGNITISSSNNFFDTHIDKKMVKRFQDEQRLKDKLIFEKIHKYGIRYIKIYTDDEPLKKIHHFLSR